MAKPQSKAPFAQCMRAQRLRIRSSVCGEPVFRCAIDQRKEGADRTAALPAQNRQYRVGAVIPYRRGSPSGIPRLPQTRRIAPAKRGLSCSRGKENHRGHPHAVIHSGHRAPRGQENQLPVITACQRKAIRLLAEPLRFMTLSLLAVPECDTHAQR